MTIFDAVKANIAALRHPENAGYPDGARRCEMVANELELALVNWATCEWCGQDVGDAPILRPWGSFCSPQHLDEWLRREGGEEAKAAERRWVDPEDDWPF